MDIVEKRRAFLARAASGTVPSSEVRIEATCVVDEMRFIVDFHSGIDCSVLVEPHVERAKQTRAFGLPIACSKPCAFGDFKLSVTCGASVNCEVVNFVPMEAGRIASARGILRIRDLRSPRVDPIAQNYCLQCY